MFNLIVNLAFILFVAISPILAQDFTFQKAMEDYTFKYDAYTQAHTEYELSRSQYQQSKTLASQQKAQEGTFGMLSTRDDAVTTYLTMLRMRMSEAQGISADRLQVLQTRIDTEVSYFENHKTTLSSAESLNDQTADSFVAKTRYEKTTVPLIYDVLTEIAVGKQVFLREQQKAIVTELEDKILQIRTEGELPTDDMERGLLEVKNRIARSEQKEVEARKIIAEAKSDNVQLRYSQVLSRLGEAVQYLKEANTYLNEIMDDIKFG